MVQRLNKYWCQAARGESGFTLVEQIVTLAILGLVLTAAMAALATGALGLNVATSRNEAMNLAQAQMECIKTANYPYDVNVIPCDMSTSRYTLTTAIDDAVCPGAIPNSRPPDVQRIEVTVTRGSNVVLCLEDLKVNRP